MTRVGFSPSGVTGTQDVDIKTLGGSVVPAGPLPISGTVSCAGTFNVTCSTVHATQVGTWDISLPGTIDVDIKTLGGSVVPAGPLPVNATCSTVHADQIGTWDVSMTGTLDVDIKTLGGSVVPFGPLPVDFVGTISVGTVVIGGTLDVDIKTLGGSVVPFGPLPVDLISPSTLDVDIRTVGGSTVGDTIPVSGTVDISGLSGTLDVDIKTLGGSVVPFGPLPTEARIYGYDGANWDELKTTDAIAAGTIDEGLLGMGLVERNHYCVGLFSSTVFTTSGTLVCSAQHDISKFYTKTICHYVTGSASTIEVWARCCSGDTMKKYYEDLNVASTKFLTISFTEALHDAYACVEVTSTLGTISTSLAMQS